MGFIRPNGATTLIQGDAVETLALMEPESVDLIVTDPAYESLEKHRSRGTTTRLKNSKASSNQWFPIFPNERFPDLFGAMYRVLKKHRHFYMFCDQETMFIAKPMAEAAGFRFWKPIVFDKQAMGMGYHYRARYELILFFEKGKRKLNDLGVSDVISCKRVRSVCEQCENQRLTQRDTDRSSLEADGESNTELSGRTKEGLYRMGGRSITRTELSSTIGSTTSNSLTQSRTSEFTQGANSETVSGGNPAAYAKSSNRSPSITGILPQTNAGQYLENADRALSQKPSKRKGAGVCATCGARKRKAFPTEKPVDVAKVLVEQSSAPGEFVCDPFMGSGSVGAASISLSRRFFGIDISNDSVQFAQKRLERLSWSLQTTSGTRAGNSPAT